MSYRGYQRRDEIAGRLACAFALGVALFPTAPATGTCDIAHLFRLDHGGSDAAHIISFFHATCAALLFTTLAYFSLFLFTENPPRTRAGHDQEKARKKRRVLRLWLDHRRFDYRHTDPA